MDNKIFVKTVWWIAIIALILGSYVYFSKSKPNENRISIEQEISCGNPLIKGNISSSGERIYHMPSGQYYSRTAVNTSAGERWFCTENEAIEAGWRKSMR